MTIDERDFQRELLAVQILASQAEAQRGHAHEASKLGLGSTVHVPPFPILGLRYLISVFQLGSNDSFYPNQERSERREWKEGLSSGRYITIKDTWLQILFFFCCVWYYNFGSHMSQVLERI